MKQMISNNYKTMSGRRVYRCLYIHGGLKCIRRYDRSTDMYKEIRMNELFPIRIFCRSLIRSDNYGKTIQKLIQYCIP